MLNKIAKILNLLNINKSTLILGGLIQTRQQEVVKAVPVLGWIPILKYAFSSRSYVTKRSELVIFITPTIISGDFTEQKEMDKLDKTKKELNEE